MEEVTCAICKNCWAYRYCDFCIRMAGNETESIQKNIKMACENMRKATENIFKDYCVLRELGYDFETNYVKEYV